MVDVVLRPGQRRRMLVEHTAEDVAGVDVVDLAPNRRQNLPPSTLRQKALPEVKVLVDIVLEVIVDHGAVVAPRISREQLVAPRTRKDHLNEFRGQAGGVVVWITLADACFLEMPSELG